MLAKSKKKITNIQLLRAAAIICVVMIHTAPDGSYPEAGGWVQVLLRPVLNLGVATFIFLSGYLTPLKTENILSFYKKRILRVFIPYLIWTVVYSVPSFDGVGRLLRNIITGEVGEHFYYIFVYIGLVLVTPLINKIADSKYRFVGWLIAPLFTIGFVYLPMLAGFKLNEYIKIAWTNCLCGWFTYYYLGILLGNKVIDIKSKNSKLFVFLIISVIIQMLEGYIFWAVFDRGNCGTQLKLSAFLTCSILMMLEYRFITSKWEMPDNVIKKFLLFLGDASFGIYLSHMLIIRLLSKVVPIYKEIPFCLNSIIILVISCASVFIGRKILGQKAGKYLGLI